MTGSFFILEAISKPLFCHPERSEGSLSKLDPDSDSSLRSE